MEKHKDLEKSETVFVGIDLHKRTWHVTIRTFDVELFSGVFQVYGRTWNHYSNVTPSIK